MRRGRRSLLKIGFGLLARKDEVSLIPLLSTNDFHRVCKTNAEISHSLIHWKYHLNEWVIAGLEGDGYLDPEKIVERDRMRLKDRYAYANAAVDLWERNGFIKSLY